MPTQLCLDRIAAEPPPLNRQCPSICSDADFINGTHCSVLGLPVDTPFLTRDPNGGGPGVPSYCYCCCSCFTAGTPIEKTAGTFVMVQDIEAGDMILAAGVDLQWKPTRVKERSGTASSDISGLYLVFYKMQDDSETRRILATPGHLFLMADSSRFQSVQHLQPGDRLMQADGGAAEVIFGMHNQDPVPTSIHTMRMDAPFDGHDFTGHLLNTNGVVTADYTAQVYFAAEELSERTDEPVPPEIGSPAFVQRHHTPELVERLRKLLPPGFKPAPLHPIVEIPDSAERFFTDAEAAVILEKAQFHPFSNPVPQIAAQRAILLARAGIPNVLFIIDWRNETPNVYTFIDAGQTFIVITGGFLRIQGVYSDLVLLALVSMAARTSGFPCVCASDYQALAYGLRQLLADETFVHIVTRALEQIDGIFQLIGGNGERPADERCKDPGIACRQKTLTAALSFQGVPQCGRPPLPGLALLSARLSESGTSLLATFDDALETASAETAANYTLTPSGKVAAAKVSPANPKAVELTVSSIQPAALTVLSVANILSQDDGGLLPDKSRIVITNA